MSIDSTAELLFNIGANSDDAEANISRFRTILGSDLDEMSAQFASWSEDLVGEIGTVQAAMVAGASVMGAALVAVGGYLVEQTHKYEEYAETIEQGVRLTGVSAESMSTLAFAAKVTGTSYEALTKGLGFFEAQVVQANLGVGLQAKTFKMLGISTEELKAGETDILPLLGKVMDRFKGLGSATEQAAVKRLLFSRGGAAMDAILRMGSEGLKEMAAEAERLGLVLTGKDLTAFALHKAAVAELTAESEAWAVEIGRRVLPMLTAFTTGVIGFVEALRSGAASGGVAGFMGRWAIETAAAQERMERLVKTMEAMGNKQLDLGNTADVAKEKFTGFTDMVDQLRQRTAGLGSEDEKLGAEMQHLQLQLTHTGEKLQELQKAGKLDPATANREIAAFVEANAEIARLAAALSAQAATKVAEVTQQWTDDLSRRIAAQGVKNAASQFDAWAQELNALRDKLAKDKEIQGDAKTALYAMLDKLQTAGETKLWRDQADALSTSTEALQRRVDALADKSYTQQMAAKNREMDALRDWYTDKKQLTEVNESLIEQIRKLSLDKIASDQAASYTSEMSRLQTRLGTMLNAEATRVTKLAAAYQKDLLEYSDAEKAKVLLTADSEAKRAAIEANFTAMRAALLAKYGMDLQALHNSQGWQGVFGSHFAEGLKSNEALMKQWATSSNQSLLMVSVALQTVKQMGSQAFDAMAKGMGAGIANALVYSKSIGAAMEAMLKSTLESLSAQAFTHAIFSLALGFEDLAVQNYTGAAAAFEAAAIFGAVGAAAGVAGSAVPGGGGASGASAGSGAGSGDGSRSGSGAASGTTAAPSSNGPHVSVVVNGHIFGVNGIEALAGAINDAVLNRDVTLTATNTKTGQVVTQ